MSGNPEALADAIASLLENPGRRAQLGQALRDRAARHFSHEQFGNRLQAVYRELLPRHH
jgi:glycosyltransferase involved in cell wall biosynthesis